MRVPAVHDRDHGDPAHAGSSARCVRHFPLDDGRGDPGSPPVVPAVHRSPSRPGPRREASATRWRGSPPNESGPRLLPASAEAVVVCSSCGRHCGDHDGGAPRGSHIGERVLARRGSRRRRPSRSPARVLDPSTSRLPSTAQCQSGVACRAAAIIAASRSCPRRRRAAAGVSVIGGADGRRSFARAPKREIAPTHVQSTPGTAH